MFCPHCGRPTPEGKPFCINCGQSLPMGDPFRPAGEQPPFSGSQDTSAPAVRESPAGESDQQGSAYAYTPPPYVSGPEPVRTVSFGEAVRGFFAHYADFSGRATRAEYWYATLFILLASLGVAVVGGFVFGILAGMIGSDIPLLLLYVLYGVFSLAILVPSLSISWRRLHDIGRSGGWYFICLVPTLGSIVLLVFCCLESQEDNRFGPRRTDSNRDSAP